MNWGLGHASRIVPLIHKLLKNNYEVIVAADKLPAILLKKEFPNIKHIKLSGYNIKYLRKKSAVFSVFLQIPSIIFGTIKEHKELKKIVKKFKPKLIISDNRYGLFCTKIPTIFITHQISVKLPKFFKIFEYNFYKLNRHFINKFDKCLIPDFSEKNNLSGDLSHKYSLPKNAEFIGYLSQFENNENENKTFSVSEISENYFDIMFIISGPEPQRSVFEKLINSEISKIKQKILIVSGKPGNLSIRKKNNILKINHLTRTEMKKAILNSEIIICRAGYTSVMDLFALKKKAILIPTPGQTEQEYLSKYLSEKGLFISFLQQKFNLEIALKSIQNFTINQYNFNNKNNSDFIQIVKKLINSDK